MTPIGGYFGLELSRGSHDYHTTPYTFKSGRSSLHFILNFLQPSMVYIPFYTCGGLLESFGAAGTPYRYYEINQQLEPYELPVLLPGEYFLYINYFDLKRSCVDRLSTVYKDHLIVDGTQAFFLKGNGRSWFFNSCRKFFGVPDGSYLYPPLGTRIEQQWDHNENYIVQHLLARFNQHPQQGYPDFLVNEQLCGTHLASMSVLSAYLLSNVNYQQVMDRRRNNFQYLESMLAKQNLCSIPYTASFVPMFYPLLLDREISRSLLGSNNLYIPVLWKDVIERDNRGFRLERKLSANLLPLPVDQRYNRESMNKILHVINEIR